MQPEAIHFSFNNRPITFYIPTALHEISTFSSSLIPRKSLHSFLWLKNTTVQTANNIIDKKSQYKLNLIYLPSSVECPLGDEIVQKMAELWKQFYSFLLIKTFYFDRHKAIQLGHLYFLKPRYFDSEKSLFSFYFLFFRKTPALTTKAHAHKPAANSFISYQPVAAWKLTLLLYMNMKAENTQNIKKNSKVSKVYKRYIRVHHKAFLWWHFHLTICCAGVSFYFCSVYRVFHITATRHRFSM